jgi:isocitrate dehydrogenase
MQKITIAYGDGIGPEIMESVLQIFKNAEINLDYNIIEVGKNIYKKGFNSGLMPSAWQDLENSKILLKAPITTPQGGGYKSLNVTLRRKLGLYANIRPIRSFYPFIKTNFENMDLAIIRENEEDLYTGVEHRHSENSYQCLKIVTRQGCEKIVRFAFEYAVKNNRKKVSCFSKDNIMKITDGLLHEVFNDIAKDYPQIKNDHHIIDIATARVASKPQNFDVIVTTNLYGDIISDVAAEISGSVGLAGSANIGQEYAMFEAIHGSAPDIANKDIANPSGLIQASIMMLNHIGLNDKASLIHNALFKTIEDGIHTADIYQDNISVKKVGTKDFTKAVIDNIGSKPVKLAKANFAKSDNKITNHNNKINNIKKNIAQEKTMIGFDLFIDYNNGLEQLIKDLKKLESEIFEVKTISCKGLLLWPVSDKHMIPNSINGLLTLRVIAKNATEKVSNIIKDKNIAISHKDIIDILQYFTQNNLDFVKFEGLYHFNGKAGYCANQGE